MSKTNSNNNDNNNNRIQHTLAVSMNIIYLLIN